MPSAEGRARVNKAVSLDDKYSATAGAAYMTGIQALVRLPMTQMRRDRAAGLDTAAFISGYRGSPLGIYDQQLVKARDLLAEYDVTFQPGVNEDLAAAAVWGSQQAGLSPGARKDGVLGIWYGKGPGVDRSGDVFKHANAAGTSALGGVLAFAGDDHTCKSSSIPHQSDHAFMSALMPCLYPSSIHEFIEIGLLGIAMSRFSGCWVGMKVISETVETTAVVDLAGERRRFVLPEFEMPPGGLNLRWPDPPLVQDERLQEYKGYAALAFARANRLDEITLDTPGARFGIVGSGKAYEDVRQALHELGIGPEEARAIGLRLCKVRMTWPLEPANIREFSEGLEEVLVVEERREIIENQIKQQLFNWHSDTRPRIVGKLDEDDRRFLPHSKGLTVEMVGRAIAERLLAFDLDPGLRARIEEKLSRFKARERELADHIPPVVRPPYYCAGCPHNTSTRVPEGSRVLAGIGCHFMAQWMERRTETFTHMGGEGVPWTAAGRYTDERHVFVNMGDGTYFHSGQLAIRQSVSAGANVTYKLLYNDAVAMTGGQPVDGTLKPDQITHQLHHEGVVPIYLLSERPGEWPAARLAPGVIVRHRDEIDAVMETLREVPGCSAIVYVQTCAAEKRRRRKRGLMEDPDMRVWINPAVCEGCGDCSLQSNCVAIEPLETEMGRKREINQSACNKDYSCLKGFCPSFVTLRGAKLRRGARAAPPDLSDLPEPEPPGLDRVWNIAVTGVGGTGVLTIGALIAMAANIEGKNPMVLDMAGLAQKGGAVLSHIRLAPAGTRVTEPRIASGTTDLLLAADGVVATSREGITLCDPARTHVVLNTRITPVADFARHRDFDFRAAQVERTVRKAARPGAHVHDFGGIARALTGDEIGANVMMLGYAWQAGLVPLAADAIEQAIGINGVAVEANIDAFRWGRLLASDPARVGTFLPPPRRSLADLRTEEVIAHRAGHLARYQNEALARRYRELVAHVAEVAEAKLFDTASREALTRAVALNYAKVLAYKDEYEIARLYAEPAFREQLGARFEGDFRLSFNLAPPFLAGTTPNGRPRKREFGAAMPTIFRLLAKLRGLRGTPFDPFRHTAERRAERALIATYEEDVARALAGLAEGTLALHVEILSLPDAIRGFGPVKTEAMRTAEARRAALIARLGEGLNAGSATRAAE
ncbi:indolepyruvate ferredoxin oxidoreductase family protein [Amaricoccus solimangrovi]|uniref:Indolepyruvate ferredoxin oxidoreductase family protein n=2 Tax=Amaricoccus solimangrovi TaxID=2589815 RepID=A0A501X181_9RHOB|nr:indolepyruvate ferredoxin oxidoreductase family protein [Amaricoccus solimangrovi]